MQQRPHPFSASEFRQVMGGFATGITIVTTVDAAGDTPYGMTASSFSSVSLDPPLVLVCVISGTTGEQSLDANGVFAVNIITEHQEPLSRYFASRDRPRGKAAFANVPHRTVVTGSPVIDACAAFVDCRVHAQHEAGDHVIFIGEVLALGTDSDEPPLLFHGGSYRTLAPS